MQTVGRRVAIGVAVLLVGACGVVAEPFENPKIRPPQAKPQRRSAGESMPPLPLPATPLRRSERKRQPAPPALVGMINFSAQGRMENGQRVGEAFPTTQVDIEQLINFANVRLNIQYRYLPTDLRKFSWDPEELPLLYVTGWTPMPELSGELVEKLRRYLYDGGTLVMHAQCGRREFTDTARREIRKLFPDRPLKPLDTDCPLYWACYQIDKMQFRRNAEPHKATEPYLEAVYIGCRPGVILSPIDLNCTWDTNNPIEGGTLYHRDDGLRLGVNVIAVTLANFQYARAFGAQKVFHQQDTQTRDQLVLAQIVHNGDWDPTPHALPSLMKYIEKNTTLNVQFKRRVLPLTDADLFKHRVIYMTGLRKFDATDPEVANLRKFLRSGGVLIADAAAGQAGFDAGFRGLVQRALPEAELKALPADCPVYQMPFPIRQVQYTARVQAESPGLNRPSLEGAYVDGQLAVIYSSYSLSNGWEAMGLAYDRGYEAPDALRLGVNIIAHAMTH
jgi:hypothetical protein